MKRERRTAILKLKNTNHDLEVYYNKDKVNQVNSSIPTKEGNITRQQAV
tara:strand:+ start:940 stop:1086 length:147 start_codon:yes stop_codon:yes gene_type:complete